MAEGDDLDFEHLFAAAKGAFPGPFARIAWQSLSRGRRLPSAGEPGSLEAYLQARADAGGFSSAEDVHAALREFYARPPGASAPPGGPRAADPGYDTPPAETVVTGPPAGADPLAPAPGEAAPPAPLPREAPGWAAGGAAVWVRPLPDAAETPGPAQTLVTGPPPPPPAQTLITGPPTPPPPAGAQAVPLPPPPAPTRVEPPAPATRREPAEGGEPGGGTEPPGDGMPPAPPAGAPVAAPPGPPAPPTPAAAAPPPPPSASPGAGKATPPGPPGYDPLYAQKQLLGDIRRWRAAGADPEADPTRGLAPGWAERFKQMAGGGAPPGAGAPPPPPEAPAPAASSPPLRLGPDAGSPAWEQPEEDRRRAEQDAERREAGVEELRRAVEAAGAPHREAVAERVRRQREAAGRQARPGPPAAGAAERFMGSLGGAFGEAAGWMRQTRMGHAALAEMAAAWRGGAPRPPGGLFGSLFGRPAAPPESLAGAGAGLASGGATAPDALAGAGVQDGDGLLKAIQDLTRAVTEMTGRMEDLTDAMGGDQSESAAQERPRKSMWGEGGGKSGKAPAAAEGATGSPGKGGSSLPPAPPKGDGSKGWLSDLAGKIRTGIEVISGLGG